MHIFIVLNNVWEMVTHYITRMNIRSGFYCKIRWKSHFNQRRYRRKKCDVPGSILVACSLIKSASFNQIFQQKPLRIIVSFLCFFDHDPSCVYWNYSVKLNSFSSVKLFVITIIVFINLRSSRLTNIQSTVKHYQRSIFYVM